MSSESLHAPRDRLSPQTLTHHQAIVSLIEELEAADWYRQRADDCEEAALKDILLHNMREEMEHACMILEWLRRNVPEWASNMDTYLYTEAPITAVEEQETGASSVAERPAADSGKPNFTVGTLKGEGN